MSDELDITIVTGLSGAGRSEAANVLEDLGFFVIDNLPPLLIPKVAELARAPGRPPTRYALGADIRSGALEDLHVALEQLREAGARTRILFLEAADDVLVRRYEASRRKHPLGSGERMTLAIAELERLFALLLPAYVREGKSYLSVGVGCTGGHHRSVVLAEELARILERLGFPARVHHRDLERG